MEGAVDVPDAVGKEGLARLAWLVGLHRIAGVAAFLLLGVLVVAAPGLVGCASYALVLVALAVVPAVESAVAALRRRPGGLQERHRRRLALAMAAIDVAVTTAAVHLSGGVDSPALAAVAAPPVAYGCFLSRRDAWGLAAGAMALLVAVVGPQPGGADHAAGIRLLSTCALTALVTHLTTFVGDELRRRDADARRLAEACGRLMESRERFVATVSHDLRGPLAVIRMACEVLRRYGSRLDEAQRLERFDKIEAAVAQMVGLLDDVVTLERVESGATVCDRRRVDVVALCQGVVAELEAEGGAPRGLVVSSEGETLEADVDPHLVREIVRNLAGNGLKYSPGGGAVVVEVGAAPGGVVLRVRDEGIGIPPEDQPRLFEPFHRGGNVGAIPGAGLGLAITRKAVELHGGTIDLESRPGAGSVFEVRLAGAGRIAA